MYSERIISSLKQESGIIKGVPEFGPLFREYLPFLKWRRLGAEWFMLGAKK